MRWIFLLLSFLICQAKVAQSSFVKNWGSGKRDPALLLLNLVQCMFSPGSRYVTYTSSEEDHNLVVVQFYRHIYYRVSQPIIEGTELRVWIGRDYASLLGLGMGEFCPHPDKIRPFTLSMLASCLLCFWCISEASEICLLDTGDSVKCQVGDKENFLRLLQDIQLVTLPESSSGPLWSDHSQSQSPMPVISDVTTMPTSDSANESGSSSLSGFASPVSFSCPNSYSYEKYDFLPGTEKLLSNPSTTRHSPWYFFGFETDPTGQPLDRSTVVCKLCWQHVGCGGGPAEIQNHLTSKHHLRPHSSSKERSAQTTGDFLLLSVCDGLGDQMSSTSTIYTHTSRKLRRNLRTILDLCVW